MDPFVKPTTWLTPRLVSMTITTVPSVSRQPRRGMDRVHSCQTLALSLDEALARARQHYGPITLNGWGSRRMPVESLLVGGGVLLPSRHDADHKDSLKRLRPSC
jgi:hypothetical protein